MVAKTIGSRLTEGDYIKCCVTETLVMGDELGGLESKVCVRSRGGTPFRQSLDARKGVPGRIDFHTGIVLHIVGKLIGLFETSWIEDAVAPMGIYVASGAYVERHRERFVSVRTCVGSRLARPNVSTVSLKSNCDALISNFFQSTAAALYGPQPQQLIQLSKQTYVN